MRLRRRSPLGAYSRLPAQRITQTRTKMNPADDFTGTSINFPNWDGYFGTPNPSVSGGYCSFELNTGYTGLNRYEVQDARGKFVTFQVNMVNTPASPQQFYLYMYSSSGNYVALGLYDANVGFNVWEGGSQTYFATGPTWSNTTTQWLQLRIETDGRCSAFYGSDGVTWTQFGQAWRPSFSMGAIELRFEGGLWTSGTGNTARLYNCNLAEGSIEAAAGTALIDIQGIAPGMTRSLSASASVALIDVQGIAPGVTRALSATAGTALIDVQGIGVPLVRALTMAAGTALLDVQGIPGGFSGALSHTASIALLDIQGISVGISNDTVLVAGTALIDIGGISAGVSFGPLSITAGTALVDVQGVAPTLVRALSAPAGTALLDVAGVPPSLVRALDLAASTGLVDVQGVPGGVTLGNLSVAAATALIDVQGVAGGFSGALSTAAGTALIDVQGIAPSIVRALSATAGVALVDIQGVAPSVARTLAVAANIALIDVRGISVALSLGDVILDLQTLEELIRQFGGRTEVIRVYSTDEIVRAWSATNDLLT